MSDIGYNKKIASPSGVLGLWAQQPRNLNDIRKQSNSEKLIAR